MNNNPNKQIEPICRFGPGGDFVSVWPPQSQSFRPPKKQPANLLGRLNEIIIALLGSASKENLEYVVESSDGKSAYSTPTAAIKSDSRFSGWPMLFADDSRIGLGADNKPKYNIRAYRRTAKKRPVISFADHGSLFEANFKSAKLLNCLDNGIANCRSQVDTAIPLAGKVAAGVPIEAIENLESLSLNSCFGNSDDIFALEVKGDSMTGDGIADGDFVICRKRSTADNGQLVVAIVDDENATLKRFYKEKSAVRLQPANDNYDPIYSDNCRIEAVVVGLVRKL